MSFWSRTMLVLGALGIGGVLLVPPPSPSSPPDTAYVAAPEEPVCVLAARWVEERAANLPTSLAQLSQLPLAYRRAVYRASPVEVRVGLFHEHLTASLGDPTLTPAQRDFVLQLLDELPELVTSGPDSPRLEDVEAQAREVLGGKAGGVVARLGPDHG